MFDFGSGFVDVQVWLVGPTTALVLVIDTAVGVPACRVGMSRRVHDQSRFVMSRHSGEAGG